jgi:hypothetical protein
MEMSQNSWWEVTWKVGQMSATYRAAHIVRGSNEINLSSIHLVDDWPQLSQIV